MNSNVILLQYQNSPTILKLIDSFKYLDPSRNIQDIYNLVFNIKTANSYGLDNWGRILGVSRYINLIGEDYFGFKESNFEPFNQSPFYTGQRTGNYKLEDEQYRKVLLLACARVTTDATLPSINHITSILFEGRGICKVIRSGIMKISFIFNFTPLLWETSLLRNNDIVPVPCGVDYELIINNDNNNK